MQEIRHDGTKGPVVPFDEKQMAKSLEDDSVKSVSVFKDPAKEVPPSSPKKSKPLPKTFLLQKGMKVSLGNYLYKVTASRPNGKISLKVVRKIKE